MMADKKLQRFSDAITSLDALVRWWRLLSSVEKSQLGKISQLVNGCEATFHSERQGWVATSMANQQLLDAAAGDAQGSSGKKKDKDLDAVPVDSDHFEA